MSDSTAATAAILTIADLRRLTGEASHVLNFALQRFGPEPAGRIGNTRYWLEDQLPAIRSALAKTAARSQVAERRKGVGE